MSILHEYDIFLLLPEIFLSITAICLLVYGVIIGSFETVSELDNESSKSSINSNHLIMNNVVWLCILGLLLTVVILCNGPLESGLIFFNTLLIDDLTFFFKLLLLIASTSVFLMSISYFKSQNINAYEYAILMLLATCSMMLMISSYDLLALYLTIELQSLALYVLAASKRQSEFSTEAGIKYFILGSFSSGILLFGSSIIYGFTGTTNFGNLAQLFNGFINTYTEPFTNLGSQHGVLIGILFVSIGFLFKLSAAPFHMWAPDVYEGAPTAITAFFSIAPKVAFLGVFVRLFMVSLHEFSWQPIILICSILSMIVGSLSALAQNKIKRLVAFSAIGHIGYMLMGTCCGTVEGIQSVFIYLVIYIIMTICLFAFVLSLRFNNNQHIKYIQDISVLATTNPTLAITFTICLFSMAGIPPLAGFCSKFYLFFAALGSSLYVPAFIGITTSCISCFYYIRLIKIMYFEKPTQLLQLETIDKPKAIILAITLFIITTFFLYPAPLFINTHKLALLLAC